MAFNDPELWKPIPVLSLESYFCLGVPMFRSNMRACLLSRDTSESPCLIWEPCIILKIIIILVPSLPLCLLDNSTSVILFSHIVFSKHWVLFMALLWPFASSPRSSKIIMPDWSQYPEKVWPVWVEGKDYLIITLIIIHNKTIRRKKN